MISIDRWAGLVTNASPYSIPPGAAVTQVNVQCLSPGQLTVRQGLQAYTFASTVAATQPVISAFAFPHGAAPIVVYQDSAGRVFAGAAIASTGGGLSGVPSAPRSPSAVAGNASALVSWTAPEFEGGAGGITGYNVQQSSDGGATWTFATSVSTTSATVSGLTNGSAYVFRVAASNYYGISTFSSATSSVMPVGAPESPTIVSATAGNASVVLDWDAPANNGGSAITDYRVEYSSNAGQSWSIFADGTSTTTLSTVTGLTNGQQYVFRVAAINSVGMSDYASYMTPVMPVGVPDQITSLTATYGNAQVSLLWQAPGANHSGGLTDYVIQLSTDGGTTWGTLSDGTSLDTSYIVTQLTNGTSYTFRVAAVNAVGTGPYSLATEAAIPRTTPGTPTNLSVTPGNAQASLSWTAPSSTGGAAITDYRIQVSVAGGAYSTISRAASTATSYTATGLTNGSTHTFRVAAINSEGAGSYVTASPVTPQTVPLAPTNVLTTIGSEQVTVRWTAPTDTGGSSITDYTVQYSSNSGSSWTTFSSATSTATQRTVTGLANGTAYVFRVAAVSSVGTGNYSTASDPATPVGVPSAPTNAAVTGGNTQMFSSWDAPSSDGGTAITGYVLQYARYSATNPNWITYGTVTGTLSYTIAGLTNGYIYIFRVAAVNAVGVGPYSTQSAQVTVGQTPAAPTGLTFSNAFATTQSNTTLTLSWTAPNSYGSTITDYVIQTSLNGSTWTTYTDGVSAGTSYTFSGLDATTTYYFRVAAVSTVGPGTYSTSSSTRIAYAPATPTVTATASAGYVTLSWSDASNRGAAITSVRVNAVTGNDDILNANVDLVARTAIVPNSCSGTQSYRVYLINLAGESSAGTSNTVTLQSGGSITAPTILSTTFDNGVCVQEALLPDRGYCEPGYLAYDISTDDGSTWTAVPQRSSLTTPYTTSSPHLVGGRINTTSYGRHICSIGPAPTSSFKLRCRLGNSGFVGVSGAPYATTGTLTKPATNTDALLQYAQYIYNSSDGLLYLRNSSGVLSSTDTGESGPWNQSNTPQYFTTPCWEWWQNLPPYADDSTRNEYEPVFWVGTLYTFAISGALVFKGGTGSGTLGTQAFYNSLTSLYTLSSAYVSQFTSGKLHIAARAIANGLYINGSAVNTGGVGVPLSSIANGSYLSTGAYARITSLRLTAGVIRYPNNFIPPAEPFPAA